MIIIGDNMVTININGFIIMFLDFLLSLIILKHRRLRRLVLKDYYKEVL